MDGIENTTESVEATVVTQGAVMNRELTHEQYIALNTFAQSNALKYGIELMGGFYHTQEVQKHYADTEDNWHKLIDDYSRKEVK